MIKFCCLTATTAPNSESDSNARSISTSVHTLSAKLFPSEIKLLYKTENCALECVTFSHTP